MDIFLELAKQIPDVEMLLALEPEELGAKLLFFWQSYSPQEHVNPDNFDPRIRLQPAYPQHKWAEIALAYFEVFSWLTVQGLAVRASGRNQNLQLSRRGRKIKTQEDFSSFKIATLLPREILHPKIAEPVWHAFLRGDFDVAAFRAMKAVEVSVREAAHLTDSDVGVKLMRKAFSPESGPLADPTTEAGERQGWMDLFAGAVACYKNPHSHRDVNLSDPAEALEIILLANHLLRIVDARRNLGNAA